MTFFNQKEEVIEIQLTSYGKYKLSQGKLRPAYYAFFDDDICYDPEYTGVSLSSDEEYSETRIQINTPSLRPQTAVVGVDRIQKKTKELQNSGYDTKKYNDIVDDFSDREVRSLPIGSAEPSNVYAPSWEIRLLRSEIDSGSYVDTTPEGAASGSSNSYIVPTFSASVEYTTHIYTEEDIFGATSLSERTSAEQEYSQTMGNVAVPSNGYLINYFGDGTVVTVNDRFILLDVVENNTRTERDNFIVSVEQIESSAEDEDGQPNIIGMSFVKRPQEIVNDILLDEDQIENIDDKDIDETYVEYFMDVLADNQIDDNTVCEYVATTDEQRIRWSRVLSCSGLTEGQGSVLYSDEELIGCED